VKQDLRCALTEFGDVGHQLRNAINQVANLQMGQAHRVSTASTPRDQDVHGTHMTLDHSRTTKRGVKRRAATKQGVKDGNAHPSLHDGVAVD
jgi:hypothetical protein